MELESFYTKNSQISKYHFKLPPKYHLSPPLAGYRSHLVHSVGLCHLSPTGKGGKWTWLGSTTPIQESRSKYNFTFRIYTDLNTRMVLEPWPKSYKRRKFVHVVSFLFLSMSVCKYEKPIVKVQNNVNDKLNIFITWQTTDIRSVTCERERIATTLTKISALRTNLTLFKDCGNFATFLYTYNNACIA